MHNSRLLCGRLLRRHREALFIVAFLLAGFLLSESALCVVTGIVLLFFGLLVARQLIKLPPSAHTAYLKALAKTPMAQRLGLLVFSTSVVKWIVTAGGEADRFSFKTGGLQLPALDCSFIALPFIIYTIVSLLAVLLRRALAATKRDPDLVRQRKLWTGITYCLFMGAYAGSIAAVMLCVHGQRDYYLAGSSNSANGANFLANSHSTNISTASWINNFKGSDTSGPPPDISQPSLWAVDNTGLFSNLAYQHSFETFVVVASSVLVFLLLLQPALRLTAFLTSFCWRIVSPLSLQNIIESFLETLRLPQRAFILKNAHPFLLNMSRTLLWIIACYASLFWLFGFCGGPLGYAIQSWMLASAKDAGFYYQDSGFSPDWLFQPNFRIFIASIIALYGTAPLAITATVFLPYNKPRKIIVNTDGLSLPQGPFLSMWFRSFRLWSDLKSISAATDKDPAKSKLVLKFHSGGALRFTVAQISAQDLRVLLNSVDEHAVSCAINADVFTLCRTLEEKETEAASDGVSDSAIKSIQAQEFKSTVFAPLQAGDILPDGKSRVVKQLGTKPLCATYLARLEDGRMAVVKQFYLEEDNEETRAIAKLFQREFDLLSNLDHPGISKVLGSSVVGSSTYLMIEHRPGTDLRSIVTEHGARSESAIIAWAQQLCEIMIYLHQHKPAIIHRDLTPDNIIAGEDGQLRLIDFGAAREFLEGITGTMIGKQCYMAPEQVRGDANQRSDIYSFGGTLNFLLTGSDPIALSQSSPANSIDCSEKLDALIRDCTTFDEEQRIQSFEEVLQRLKHLQRPLKIRLNLTKPEAVA